MRPFRSFLLLLIILICFAGLSYVLPWELNLPSAETLIPEKILRIVYPGNEQPDIPDTTFARVIPDLTPEPADTSAVVDTPGPILYPYDTISQDTASHNPLQVFLDSLKYSRSKIRIMYFGDSQIEVDRITSYLRHSLRTIKGGTGPGLFLPVMPVTYTKSFYVRASTNWRRYNYLSFKNGEIRHNELGPFMAFCRYLPEGRMSPGKVKSWVRISESVFADNFASDFEYLRIIYRNKQDNVGISIKADNNPLIIDTLKKSDEVAEYQCPLYRSKNVLVEFSGNTSPDIYGISIEGSKGLVVDNIPQRGSAGLEFTMVDSENLKAAFSILNPDLIILHYGLNLATNIRNDYSYYEKGLARQISLIHEVTPGTAVVVVGLTDIAYPEGDRVVSYPNIGKIIKAQEKASFEAAAVIWDARTAMGGNSSIIRWFGMNPPLAKKDYVHFTDQGADTLAALMLSDLFTVNKVTLPDSLTAIGQPGLRTDTVVAVAPTPVAIQQKEKVKIIDTLLQTVLRYDPSSPFIFSSPSFWVFFLFVLGGFLFIYRKMFLRNLYLFLVSLFFYYKSGGLFLILLILVTVIDFSCGLFINRSGSKAGRRLFLLLSIVSNIGLLAYFKYTGFIIQTFNDLFGTAYAAKDYIQSFSNQYFGTHFNISSIILPVGISFFTFQSLSYTIDVYRRKLEPVRNIIDFGFYVSFFPQLVAGPIVRASEFIPQLYKPYSLTQREMSHAIFLIMKGLIKKIIISDFIAVSFVDRIFDLPTAHSGFENLMAVYGYGLQIYCDFSGYTDIAIGLGLLLGFRLPLNFNSPYKAANVSDFWKRWHISLSRWLKDYLYISLGGNRKGKFRTILNVMITMLLGGLWHGASLRFIIWGGLHGIALAFYKVGEFIFGERTSRSRLRSAVSVFLTFQFVSFCWIFFRSQDLQSVGLMLRQIVNDFLPSSFASVFALFGGAFALIAAGYLIHFLPEKVKESYRGLFIRIPVAAQMVIVLMIAFLLYQMRTTEIMPFIYFRF